MIPKSKLKYIKSLQIKKLRKQEGRFLVEGAKSVVELLKSDFIIISLFLTDEFFNCYKSIIPQNIEITICKESELDEAGSFVNNNAAIAIAEVRNNFPFKPLPGKYILALDDIRDPGNLGTIIRIADWYGMTNILCSENTAEFYNPKVITATMGSFTRVRTYYCNLQSYFTENKHYVYGAKLNGENIHKATFEKEGIVVIGNESNGINPNLDKFISKNLNIPCFGHAESLNAAVATAIICDNIFRSLNE